MKKQFSNLSQKPEELNPLYRAKEEESDTEQTKWENILDRFLSSTPPNRYIWDDYQTPQILSNFRDVSHWAFLPGAEKVKLTYIEPYFENCLSISFKSEQGSLSLKGITTLIANFRTLRLESFPRNPEYGYFVLEMDDLQKVEYGADYGSYLQFCHDLTMVEYREMCSEDQGLDKGIPYQHLNFDALRLISGSLILVADDSPLIKHLVSTSGKCNLMAAEELRHYVESMIVADTRSN